jgi:hypothetical protein
MTNTALPGILNGQHEALMVRIGSQQYICAACYLLVWALILLMDRL